MNFLGSMSIRAKITTFYVFAVVCFIASIFVAQWQISSKAERDDIRKNGQATNAYAINREEVRFNSTQGEVTAKPLVAPMQGTLKQFDAVRIVYDRSDPTRVVLLQDDNAFNITIWIVVVKLAGVGAVLAILGYRRQSGLKKKPKTEAPAVS